MTKYSRILKFFDLWMSELEYGNDIISYCRRGNFFKIGIYGLGWIGRQLYAQLLMENIEVVWIMDKCNMNTPGLPIVHPDEADILPADLVIVTDLNDFEEIEESICKKIQTNVISFENVLREMKKKRLLKEN